MGLTAFALVKEYFYRNFGKDKHIEYVMKNYLKKNDWDTYFFDLYFFIGYSKKNSMKNKKNRCESISN